MALDDQTMNLRVTVDSSQVAPGMDAAATQVAAGAAKMQTTVASSLRAQGRSVDEVQQIYKQLGFTGAQAAQEINAAFGASMEEVAAKTEEVAARGHVAFGRMTGEITTARFAASGLSQELGLGMPRALTTFLARSETIGPILSKAFSVVAAVALAEIVAKLPDMIQSATDALEGFDDEAKKAFGDAVEADIRLVTQLAHHKDAMAEVGTIGTAGMGRIGAESAAAKIHVQDAAAAATELTRRLINAKAELAALRAPTLTNVFTRSAEDLTQAQSKVNDLQKALDELQPFLRFGQFEEGARLSREAAAQMAEDFQKLDLSRASLSAELAHEEYTLHQTTLDQETKALEDAETRRYDIERTAAARKGASRTELETLEIEHLGKLAAIQTTHDEEMQRREKANAEAQIADVSRIAEARTAAMESGTAARLGRSPDFSAQIEAENVLFLAHQTALKQKAALDIRYGADAKTVTLTLNSDLEALEIAHQAKLKEIRDAQVDDEERDQLRLMDARVSTIERVSNLQLSMSQAFDTERLRTHEESLHTWQANELAAIQSWYAQQVAVLNEDLALVKRIYGENSVEYQKMADKLKAIDAKRLSDIQKVNLEVAKEFSKVYAQIGSEVNRALTDIITGHEAMGKTIMKVYDELATHATENILKIAERWAIGLLTHKAGALQEITVDAKTAAANTYAAVAAIPVVGPFLAPPAAAAAFAAVMAFGSFEKGGVVEQTGPAFLHAKEMVLPAPISQMVQSAAQGGHGGSRLAIHYSPRVSKREDETLRNHLPMIEQLFNRAVRNGGIKTP